MAVVDQDFDSCPLPVTEDEDATAERIMGQLRLANPRKPINPFAEILRLDRDTGHVPERHEDVFACVETPLYRMGGAVEILAS